MTFLTKNRMFRTQSLYRVLYTPFTRQPFISRRVILSRFRQKDIIMHFRSCFDDAAMLYLKWLLDWRTSCFVLMFRDKCFLFLIFILSYVVVHDVLLLFGPWLWFAQWLSWTSSLLDHHLWFALNFVSTLLSYEHPIPCTREARLLLFTSKTSMICPQSSSKSHMKSPSLRKIILVFPSESWRYDSWTLTLSDHTLHEVSCYVSSSWPSSFLTPLFSSFTSDWLILLTLFPLNEGFFSWYVIRVSSLLSVSQLFSFGSTFLFPSSVSFSCIDDALLDSPSSTCLLLPASSSSSFSWIGCYISSKGLANTHTLSSPSFLLYLILSSCPAVATLSFLTSWDS